VRGDTTRRDPAWLACELTARGTGQDIDIPTGETVGSESGHAGGSGVGTGAVSPTDVRSAENSPVDATRGSGDLSAGRTRADDPLEDIDAFESLQCALSTLRERTQAITGGRDVLEGLVRLCIAADASRVTLLTSMLQFPTMGHGVVPRDLTLRSLAADGLAPWMAERTIDELSSLLTVVGLSVAHDLPVRDQAGAGAPLPACTQGESDNPRTDTSTDSGDHDPALAVIRAAGVRVAGRRVGTR
jgi:hypothetical protein